MKNNKLLIALLSTLAAGSGLLAQTAPAPVETPSASWVLTPSVASQYMFRGVRLGGPALQPSVEYDRGALALGVWANLPLKDRVPGQSDPEFDFYGSYSFDVIKDTATLVPGFTVYTYPNANHDNGYYSCTVEPNLAFNYTVGIVKFTPKLYYDMILKGPTAEFNVSVAVPLKDLGTELDFAGTVGTYKWDSAVTHASPDIENWGDYWLIGASIPFQLTKASKLTAGVAYTTGSNNYYEQVGVFKAENTAAVGRVVFSLSYAVTF